MNLVLTIVAQQFSANPELPSGLHLTYNFSVEPMPYGMIP